LGHVTGVQDFLTPVFVFSDQPSAFGNQFGTKGGPVLRKAEIFIFFGLLAESCWLTA